MSYKRLPLIRRFEYLVAYLESIDLGHTEDEFRKHLNIVVNKLEQKKINVLGSRLRERKEEKRYLPEECLRMARNLGLIKREGKNLILTDTGDLILNEFQTEKGRQTLLQLLWDAYPDFQSTVLGIHNQPDHVIELPAKRQRALFMQRAYEQGLNLHQWSFEISRDWGTDLGILNWRVTYGGDGQMQRVYTVFDLVEDVTSSSSDLVLNIDKDKVQKITLRFPTESDNAIYRTLLSVYLEKTDRKSRQPISYALLRDEVCDQMRMTDDQFDQFIATVKQDRQIVELDKEKRFSCILYVSPGIPSTTDKLPKNLKHISPPVGHGGYMQYIRLDIQKLLD